MAYQLPADHRSRPVAVIGGGTLGRRIALMFASGGAEVRVHDRSEQVRDDAVAYVEATLPEVVAARDGAVAGSVRGDGDLASAVEGAWLVVEAIPERLDLKTPLFGQLDRLVAADTILATNSSSYPSRLVVDEVEHRERVLNVHFSMPPQQNAVDLMSDGETNPGIMTFLQEHLPRYGVFPFVARRESTGFIFNRIWAAIKRESLAVVADGVSTPEDVDAMFRINSGAPAGPFRMMDQVGLDVVLDIEDHYAAEDPHLPEGPRRLLHEYVDAGHLGVKTGRGFYRYDD
ncbi:MULTISPECIES: 3-hydroxyacyl-CoA dehydrogenase family protein [unclassified Curtobacterium]|uniref:3-hydroxyacyl-CoA dehydrogenase family protein n=1 Tax=unclassified Curtobacterium TaxID=257496 RepID=UPI000824FCE9|nr:MULTISPECIES: 3-hydroxyacyl-CoA dehydrogenase family protein [unclassified Curtobacterium]WIA98223.1 3-hydroxyacyl-CoA dehydrogenase family protein [Curtobacterium sp. MCBA15_004]WIB01477.1 3-hydroxyacyl-CoA dehydrogenase family protein [Curtobacterium sp. MCBA15_012]